MCCVGGEASFFFFFFDRFSFGARTSLVLFLSCILGALLALCCTRFACGRFLLWCDALFFKLGCLIALGTAVAYAIYQVSTRAFIGNNTLISQGIVDVWGAGVLAAAFCAVIMLFELRFLLWRKKKTAEGVAYGRIND